MENKSQNVLQVSLEIYIFISQKIQNYYGK
jgi:hypothetical protein